MSDENGSWEDCIGNEGLRVIHPDTVAQWHRRDKAQKFCDTLARITVKLCWWCVLIGAGYIAALVIQAGGKA